MAPPLQDRCQCGKHTQRSFPCHLVQRPICLCAQPFPSFPFATFPGIPKAPQSGASKSPDNDSKAPGNKKQRMEDAAAPAAVKGKGKNAGQAQKKSKEAAAEDKEEDEAAAGKGEEGAEGAGGGRRRAATQGNKAYKDAGPAVRGCVHACMVVCVCVWVKGWVGGWVYVGVGVCGCVWV